MKTALASGEQGKSSEANQTVTSHLSETALMWSFKVGRQDKKENERTKYCRQRSK